MAATSGLWSLALFMATMTAKWSLNSHLTVDGVVRGSCCSGEGRHGSSLVQNTSRRDWGVVQEEALFLSLQERNHAG